MLSEMLKKLFCGQLRLKKEKAQRCRAPK